MNPTQIKVFIHAGRAVFTLQSARTGTHFIYRVIRHDHGTRTQYFASVLVAPDVWCYVGMISMGQLVLTGGSKVSGAAPSFVALRWFLRQLGFGALPAECIFRHEGRCGRCARALTTPASIDTGLGPDCAAALGVPHEAREFIRGPKDAALCAPLPSKLAALLPGSGTSAGQD